MSIKENQTVGFCVHCDKFSLMIEGKNSKRMHMTTKRVWCQKWFNCSNSSEYENNIFEEISKNSKGKKRDNKEIEKMKDSISSFNWKDDIKNDLEWKLWKEIIDLEYNLKWLEWDKLFCGNWLIEWMLKYPAWPNWWKKLTRSNVVKDKEWRKFITYLEAQKLNPNKPIWREHKIEWQIFCTDWVCWICYKCVTSKVHDGHNLINYEDIPSRAQDIVDKIISDKKSTFDDKNYNIKMIENWRLVNKKITEEASKSIHELIDRAKDEIDIENDEHYSLKISQLNNFVFPGVEIKDLLEKFKEKTDMKLFNEIIHSANLSKYLKDKNNNIRDCYIAYLKKHGLFSNDRPSEYEFKCQISKLNKSINIDLAEFELDQDNKVKITFTDSVDQNIIISIVLDKFNTQKYWLRLELYVNEFFYLEDSNQIYIVKPQMTKLNIGKLMRHIEPQNLEENDKLCFKLFLWTGDQFQEFIKCIDKSREAILLKCNKKKNKKIGIKEEEEEVSFA